MRTQARRKNRIVPVLGLALLLLLCALCGCSRKQAQTQEEDESGYLLYYLNKDETATSTVLYEPTGGTMEELIEELLAQLSQIPEDTNLEAVLTQEISVTRYEFEGGQLSLHFASAYQELSRMKEILCRSAIVRTLCQIPEVESVSFLIGDSPLMDSKETPIGAMTADSFVENTGNAINTYTEATLKLYFTNETGDRLVPETLTFTYSSNMSVEKLVVDQLIKGPKIDGDYPTIPSETKVLGVSTKDGICYVNLDDGFLAQEYDVTEEVPIYSIVNSLTDLADVTKVQIQINGETNLVYRESIRFDEIFERNLDLIETAE